MSLSWDQVQTEFAGDETTNFGPRKETGTALYQVDTIATISTQNQVPVEVKNLVSAAMGEMVCVGIDQHLSIFKDSQHEVTIAFDHVLEDCVWSPDGSLLLVVDAGGKLYLFSAETLQSVFSYKLLSGDSTGRKSFQRIVFRSGEESGCCDLVLLSAAGVVFVFKSFNPSAFLQGGDNLMSAVQEQLKFRTVQTREVHSDTTWDTVPLGNGGVITVGTGRSMLAVWSWQDNCISLEDSIGDILEEECGIVSAKLASNDKVLFVLDERKQISLWLFPELVVLSQLTWEAVGPDTSISEFLLLETQGTQTNSLDGTRLVLLLTDKLGSTLLIRDMEQREDMYSLQLGAHTTLSRCATTQESLYLAEGTAVTGFSNKISTVRQRCLTESNPETRLQRILHKKRFEEALQFARLFQLDTELVYTAQMNQLLEQLSPWNMVCYEDNQVTAMLDQLWTSINNIKDTQLIAENCMRAALPSFADTWKLLQLCQKKLSSSGTEDTEERLQILQTRVLDLQNRLMTYKLAFGAHAYSADGWMRFQQANLLHKCRDVIQHQPHIAVLVWRRHCDEWQDQITTEVVQQVLQAVTEQLPGVSVMGWLQNDLLPFLARYLPQAIAAEGGVVQWAIQRAINMELVEKSGWPQNAISFLEMINHSVTEITQVNFTSTNDTAVETVVKTQIDVHSVLEPLRSTLSMIYQVKDLLKYDLRLSVKQFQQETQETLAFRMLDQVVMAELIKPTLEKYITPYIRAHCLDQDNIFATYIKDLLERLGHVRSYSGQSVWEDKVLAIVSFIHSPKEKCCAVLNVIKHAPLPWSPEIEQLVESGLKIKHPLAQELQEQKKIASVRKLMQDNGLKSKNVPSQDKAEDFAMFIIKQGKDRSLADALRVLKEYNISNPTTVNNVFFAHANILIRAERVLDYMKVLDGLSGAEARQLGQRIVSLTEVCLNMDSPVSEPALKKMLDQHNQQFTLAAVLTLKHLLRKATDDAAEQADLREQLDMFSKLLGLQREYHLMLSVNEYNDEVKRNKIFASFIERHLKEKKPLCGAEQLTDLYRLADLLQLQREVVQGELAMLVGRVGNLEAVLFLCRELLQAEASKELGRVLLQVVSGLLHLQGKVPGNDDGDDDDVPANLEQQQLLPIILEKLANRAVCMCDEKMLLPCLEVTKLVRLWRQVGSQCEATDLSLLQMDVTEEKPLMSSDPCKASALDTLYTDQALVMNSAVNLPLAARALAATLSATEWDEEKDREMNSESTLRAISLTQAAVAHLRENGHLQLTLRFVVITTSAVRQSLLQHNMGFPLSQEMQSWLSEQQLVMERAEKQTIPLFTNLISALLIKVLSAHRVDHRTALAYLLSAPRRVGIDCLKKSIDACNFNFRKLATIANVGVALGHLLRESKLILTCQELGVNAAWGVRLAKHKISFKEAFQGGLSAKHDVITAMAHCFQANVQMVVDFSTDFKMEAEDSLLVFLDELLKTCHNPKQLSRARTVIVAVMAMNREGFLLTKLKTIYKQTSPYDYTVMEFLLDELNKLDSTPLYEKGLKLLSYLKVYIRRSPPTDAELSKIDVTQEDKEGEDVLPKGASERVPLHPLLHGEPWPVISPELEAETLPLWLRIAQILELSTDEIYVVACQNIVRKHVSHTTSSTPGIGAAQERQRPTSARSWTVSEASLTMLKQVKNLLNSVQSCEMAMACANWVVKELPMGVDKVLGLQGCVAFAQRWLESCDDAKREKALAAFTKYSKVLRKAQTEQVLCTNGLAERQLLQLVSTPEELILQLTEHPAVISDSGKKGPVPDIYKTLTKVCEVNEVDLRQVLITAIHKWLFSQDSSDDSEVTMNLSFSNLKVTEEPSECDQSDSIRRVLYFLHRGPRLHMLKFLIDIVQSGEAESTNHLGRMHCLYCLLQIGSDSDLVPVGLSLQSIREMLRNSCYLAQLEALHIQHSAQTLDDCNMTGLIKYIWRNHRHQKSAVKLTACLCLDYKLFEHKQWAAILRQMVALRMFAELEHVLQRLRSVAALWGLPVFTSAWQAVLMAALTKATLPLNEEQLKSCLHCFNLLQSCPVSGQLNLSAMTQHFLQLELNVCAAACMMMDPTASDSDLQALLSQDTETLMEQSYQLTAQGLNLPAATQVREAVFQVIVNEGDYHKLSQQALPDFRRFIIEQDMIDDCLLYAVSNSMVPQAEMLVNLYFQRYPERHDELVAWCDNSCYEMDSSLQAYVHMKQLV